MATQDLGELRTQLLKARFGNDEKQNKLLELEKRIVMEGLKTISERGMEVLISNSLLTCYYLKSSEGAEDNTVRLFIDGSGCIDIAPLLKYSSEKTRRAYARIKYSLQ